MERVLTMWPQVRRSSGEPCPVCGSRMDARSQRVTASDLDERRTWWLASQKCEGCGSYSEELEDKEKTFSLATPDDQDPGKSPNLLARNSLR
jgi:hypothetical protein